MQNERVLAISHEGSIAAWMFVHRSDIGFERLSYQSKIISINIRISLLFIIKGETET